MRRFFRGDVDSDGRAHHGSVAFRGLLDHLKTTNYDGWIVVEQDVDR